MLCSGELREKMGGNLARACESGFGVPGTTVVAVPPELSPRITRNRDQCVGARLGVPPMWPVSVPWTHPSAKKHPDGENSPSGNNNNLLDRFYNVSRDTLQCGVIQSFANHASEDVYRGKASKQARRLNPSTLLVVAKRKLDQLNQAHVLDDLRAPPANKLEKLRGNRAGQWSIRINEQYRVCFLWPEQGPAEVEIVDYHR